MSITIKRPCLRTHLPTHPLRSLSPVTLSRSAVPGTSNISRSQFWPGTGRSAAHRTAPAALLPKAGTASGCTAPQAHYLRSTRRRRRWVAGSCRRSCPMHTGCRRGCLQAATTGPPRWCPGGLASVDVHRVSGSVDEDRSGRA